MSTGPAFRMRMALVYLGKRCAEHESTRAMAAALTVEQLAVMDAAYDTYKNPAPPPGGHAIGGTEMDELSPGPWEYRERAGSEAIGEVYSPGSPTKAVVILAEVFESHDVGRAMASAHEALAVLSKLVELAGDQAATSGMPIASMAIGGRNWKCPYELASEALAVLRKAGVR